MKSDTISVLFADLFTRGIQFNINNDKDISKIIPPFKKLIRLMPVHTASGMTTYRARRIDLSKDVNTGKGISMIEGKLVGGFDEKNSRRPPAEFCRMQRLNRDHESVFYIAEERYAAIDEVNAPVGDYISVAKFDIVNAGVNILDFSAYTKEEQHIVISDEMEESFYKEEGISARELYCGIQKIFTINDGDMTDYKVSNELCDLIKEETNIYGIRYQSHQALIGDKNNGIQGHNLCIWGERDRYFTFRGSEIEMVD